MYIIYCIYTPKQVQCISVHTYPCTIRLLPLTRHICPTRTHVHSVAIPAKLEYSWVFIGNLIMLCSQVLAIESTSWNGNSFLKNLFSWILNFSEENLKLQLILKYILYRCIYRMLFDIKKISFIYHKLTICTWLYSSMP